MSDDVIDRPSQIPRKITFIVTCDLDKGEVQVQGPIQQKLLAIKILADAIHIVTDHQMPAPRNILIPQGGNGRPPLLPS